MYKGKHLKQGSPRRKPAVLLVSLLLILCVALGGTLALLVAQSGEVKNIFTPSKVTIRVDEDIESGVKKEVKIENTGDIEAYIRATVLVTWQDEKGNVYGAAQPVEGTDYEISWTKDGWKKSSADGFYYYTLPVAAGGFTGELFTNCEPIDGRTPTGYSLAVEILGTAIQSDPASVVAEEWKSGVSSVASGGTLNIN